VNDIRTRAAQAEVTVQNLLNDPKKAEYARSRLMETSATINELFTLVRTHGDLEYEVCSFVYFFFVQSPPSIDDNRRI
jgi:hypothetical protein